MRTKMIFGRTMMQALELLWLVKGMSPDKMTLISENQACSYSHYELCLSEGISK